MIIFRLLDGKARKNIELSFPETGNQRSTIKTKTQMSKMEEEEEKEK
jgi:hypothetical protein